jgi:hypothetical protein
MLETTGTRVEVTIEKVDLVLQIGDKILAKEDLVLDEVVRMKNHFKEMLDDAAKKRVEELEQQKRYHEQHQEREERLESMNPSSHLQIH